MKASLLDLDQLLEEEVLLHEGLRDELAFECEKDGELGGTEFLKLQQRKYNLVARIENLETRRENKVRELAREWNETSEELTLSRIISKVEEDEAAVFQGRFNGLKALVEEIRHLAKESGQNAQARLKAVEATLSVVGEAARVHPTYSDAGKIRQRPPTFKNTSA